MYVVDEQEVRKVVRLHLLLVALRPGDVLDATNPGVAEDDVDLPEPYVHKHEPKLLVLVLLEIVWCCC